MSPRNYILYIFFLALYSYADASGAGKDVYEFVSLVDGHIHFIRLVLVYLPLHMIS